MAAVMLVRAPQVSVAATGAWGGAATAEAGRIMVPVQGGGGAAAGASAACASAETAAAPARAITTRTNSNCTSDDIPEKAFRRIKPGK